MSFYEILVLIHIFSAILGMGPGFVMTPVAKTASNMTELKHAYAIRNRLHQFVMIGGTLLLITGFWMGFLNTYLFQQGWYMTSLVLYLIALISGPTILVSSSKPIKTLLKEHEGEEIPSEYVTLSKKLFFYEYMVNTLFLMIIALMITKPF